MMLSRRLLNILYVGTLPPHPGGSAIVGAQLVVGLASLGHAVRAVAPVTAEALRAGDDFAARHPEVRLERVEVPHFAITLAMSSSDDYRSSEGERMKEMIRPLIAEQRPDVVVIGRENVVWHVADLTRSSAIPSISLIHRAAKDGMLVGLDRAGTQRMVHQLRGVDLLVLVAEHMAGPIQRLGLQNLAVIPNSVDLQRFSPRRRDRRLLEDLGLRNDQIVVAHVSNLKDAKRPLDIVDSAAQVLSHNPDIVYVIVGEGPYRSRMEERCRQRQILRSFRFVGWVDHERVSDYLNLADIVAMPSETEAMALVYLEAQACGRVLLASDIPAAREVIEDGQTGLLFRKGDIGHLAEQTLRAAGDASLRAAIGRRARESVQAHDLDRSVAAYERVLLELANRPPR
jgi:glycosyltransferase involved in cell wall biosynthesis